LEKIFTLGLQSSDSHLSEVILLFLQHLLLLVFVVDLSVSDLVGWVRGAGELETDVVCAQDQGGDPTQYTLCVSEERIDVLLSLDVVDLPTPESSEVADLIEVDVELLFSEDEDENFDFHLHYDSETRGYQAQTGDDLLREAEVSVGEENEVVLASTV
jgi:hypothetical protein